jgi:hypothetical protein
MRSAARSGDRVQRRPGTVWREIKVELPRPRRLEMKRKPQFVTLVGQIWR